MFIPRVAKLIKKMPPEMPNRPNNSEFPFGDVQSPLHQVDEKALEFLWAKGRIAWKDVKSATSWVEELRGNETQDEPGFLPNS